MLEQVSTIYKAKTVVIDTAQPGADQKMCFVGGQKHNKNYVFMGSKIAPPDFFFFFFSTIFTKKNIISMYILIHIH